MISLRYSDPSVGRFSHLGRRTTPKPAGVLLDALNEPNLDARVAEALPWLLTYVDMDWDCWSGARSYVANKTD